MNKTEIEHWRDLYDKEYKDIYGRKEEELRKKIQENKFLTKHDLEEIIRWKFEYSLPGRAKINLDKISSLKSSYIEKKTRKALSYEDDEVRVLLLTNIERIGNSVASVILTFFNPDIYGILDFHAWEELYNEKRPNDLYTNPNHLLDFFEKLREISRKTGLSCRNIEKAYFMKNRGK
jgi:hypothetical protein